MCKSFCPKIQSCEFFDKNHVCTFGRLPRFCLHWCLAPMIRPSASFLVIIMFISSKMRMIFKIKGTFFYPSTIPHQAPRLKFEMITLSRRWRRKISPNFRWTFKPPSRPNTQNKPLLILGISKEVENAF